MTKATLQPHDYEAFMNEVNILSECKGQKNVLEFLHFFDTNTHYYLITEKVSCMHRGTGIAGPAPQLYRGLKMRRVSEVL